MNKRLIFWSLFTGSCAVIAAVPEFWPADPQATVPPTARPSPPALPIGALASAAPSAAAAKRSAEQRNVGASASGKSPAAGAAPIRDIFAAKSWAPPPPKPVAPLPPPPPPPPSAPPMPYKFIGKMDDATSLKAFLNRGERVYVVSVGEILDHTYRVDSIKAGQMTLIYLPLNIPQTLSVGSPL